MSKTGQRNFVLYIRCIYGMTGRVITEYTVICYIYRVGQNHI